MKTPTPDRPLIAFQFRVTLAALNHIRELEGASAIEPDPENEFEATLRVVVDANGVKAEAHRTDRLGGSYWSEIGNLRGLMGPDGHEIDENEVIAYAFYKLAELAMERVPHHIAGEATVLDLGVL